MSGKRFALVSVITLAALGAAVFALTTSAAGPHRLRLAHPANHADRRMHSTDVVSQVGLSGSSADPLAVAEAHFGMVMSQATDLGTVGAGSAAVDLLTAPTANGGSCLISESSAGPSGSCLDTPSLFTQKPVAYLVLSDGGPDQADINYIRIVGVVEPSVNSVEVELSSGTKQQVAIASTGAFEYDTPLADIRAGITPSTLIVSRGGDVLGTYPVS